MNPTQKDIDLLTSQPDLASKFDEVYGAGASQQFLKMDATDVVKGAAVNFLPSVGNMIKDVATAVTSPVQTLSSLADLTMGAFQNFTPLDLQKSFGATKDDVERTKQLANSVGQFYKDRYGSVEGAKRAIANDPAGVMADVATVFTGGSTLPGKMGAVASKTASMVDPLSLTAKGLGATYSAIGNVTKPIVGMTSGAGTAPITEAVSAGRAGGQAAESFKGNLRGDIPMTNVLEDAKIALNNMRKQRNEQYKQNKTALVTDKPIPFEDIDSALLSSVKSLMGEGGILKDKYAFEHLKKTKEIIDEYKSKNINTPIGLDEMKQKIYNEVLLKIPVDERNATRVVGEVTNKIKDSIAQKAPTYSKMMKEYEASSGQILEIEKALKLGKKASAESAMRNLQSLMRNNVNTSYGYRTDLAKQLEQVGGKELMPALAGQALNTWTPRGLQSATTIPSALAAFSAGGAGLAVPSLLASSPRVVGEAAYATGALERKLSALKDKIPDAEYARLANLLYQSQQPKGLLE
jgi:hypothetical protein